MPNNINDKYIDELPDEFKKSYLDYKNGLFEIEPWGSHQPLLIHLVNTVTEGDVIEFGIGYNSTPLLHFLCEKQNRNLFSYEFDFEYYKNFKHYETDNHKIFFLNENKLANNEYKLNDKHYSIALIDSHPSWTRQYAINYFSSFVDYLIVHDISYMKNGIVESDNDYNFNLFKNVLIFNKINRTSALITNKEISDDISKIFK